MATRHMIISVLYPFAGCYYGFFSCTLTYLTLINVAERSVLFKDKKLNF